MIAEALKLIQDTAKQAAGPQKLPVANDHAESVLVNGETITVEKSHPPRKHVVYDIDSLSAFVADLKDVVVWHDANKVVAVLNDSEYRDSLISLPLPIHPTFKSLEDMEDQDYQQKALIDYLRLNLKKEVDAGAPTLISALRDIKFVSNSSGDAQITHGRESMGKRIEQSVTGVDALPEDFILRVPLWLHLDAVVAVECALVVDTANATFRCGPKPGAIEQAKVAGQTYLGTQLESACDKAVVYFGSP